MSSDALQPSENFDIDLLGLYHYSIRMVDDLNAPLPSNTIYNLLEQMSVLLYNRYYELRKGTRYSDIRPSDIRVFVEVARKARGESEIAKSMNVSRQAIQSSVKRLVAMKFVEVVPKPDNRRNKIVQITERGAIARATAAEQIRTVEGECAAVIGSDELERLRGLLMHLTTGYKANHAKKPSNGAHATGV